MILNCRLEWDEWNLAHIAKHKVTPPKLSRFVRASRLNTARAIKNALLSLG